MAGGSGYNLFMHATGITLGLVLAVAAGMKFYELSTSPFVERPVGQAALATGEWTLALLLLSGLFRPFVWPASIGCFSVFAAYTLYRALDGQDSCGCFGPVRINPWLTLGFDVLAVTALALTLPAARRAVAWHRASLRRTAPALAVLGLLALGPALITLGPARAGEAAPPEAPKSAGSPESAAESGADDDEKSPPGPRLVVDVGYIKPGGTTEVSFRLANPADEAVAITKIHVECSCTKLLERPDRIPPGGIEIPVRFEAPETRTRYTKRIVIETDDPDSATLTLTLNAAVGLPLSLEPEAVDYGRIEAGRTYTRRIALVNAGDDPVRLLYSTADVRGVHAGVPREPVEPGTHVRIPVVFKPGDDPPAEGRGTLTVHTDSKVQPTLVSRIAWEAD